MSTLQASCCKDNGIGMIGTMLAVLSELRHGNREQRKEIEIFSKCPGRHYVFLVNLVNCRFGTHPRESENYHLYSRSTHRNI